MSASVSVALAPPAARILIEPGRGWCEVADGAARLWFAGHLYEPARAGEAAARELLATLRRADAANDAAVARILRGLHGHFAFVTALDDGTVVAAVDRVQSVPLFLGQREGGTLIAARARVLAEALGVGPAEIDPDAALAFAMGGFTIGAATLYRPIRALMDGEFAICRPGDVAPAPTRYYAYRPWRAEPVARDAAARGLRETILGLLETVRDSLGGRPVVVPLSGGLDSRLMVAGLAHLGHRDVTCVSYGQPGNHEAETARRVAERLGLRWIFAPRTLADMRAYFAGEDHRDYQRFADTFQSVPTEQDAATFSGLARALPDGAVVINGQSGDYITGGHVARSLVATLGDAPDERLWAAMVDKHFSLWPDLKTPERLAAIAAQLRADLVARGAPVDAGAPAWALYEASEYGNRQVKHVIQGQRVYDRLGFDWRMPLWDDAFVDFWERMPLEHKRGQNLYRETLIEADWGGVWSDIPAPAPRTVVPRWIRPLRLAGKALCAPCGRAAWHRFERRFLQYRMDVLCLYAAIPYGRIALDKRDGASVMSWINEVYLAAKGLDGAGRLRPPAAS